MKSRLLGAARACMLTVGIASYAKAAIVTVDPDTFPDGTDISNTLPGITLSA
jgi:hypothetical protein